MHALSCTGLVCTGMLNFAQDCCTNVAQFAQFAQIYIAQESCTTNCSSMHALACTGLVCTGMLTFAQDCCTSCTSDVQECCTICTCIYCTSRVLHNQLLFYARSGLTTSVSLAPSLITTDHDLMTMIKDYHEGDTNN